MKRVLVPLAPGFEEIEAATIIDVLRRAGAEVTVAGTIAGAIDGSHGVAYSTDATLADVRDEIFDLIVLPGGMPGATNMVENEELIGLLQDAEKNERLVGAICAAPLVLSRAGLLADRTATSYPSFQEQIKTREYSNDRVVVDRGVVTSRGPGTALEFSLELVSQLFGKEKRDQLAAAMLVRA